MAEPSVPLGLVGSFPPGPGEGVGGLSVGAAAQEDEPDDERRRRARQKDVEPGPSFGAVAQSGILPQVGQAQSEYQEALKQRAKRVGERIAEEKQAITAVPHEAPPAEPTLAKPPSVGLTPFLAPVEGERPENTIAKLIQGVGLLATGVAGRKDARASLAALTGALKGWQEGDKERADRHFADWQAQSETLLKNWQAKRSRWKDIMEDRALTIQERARLWELDMLKEGVELDSQKAQLEGAQYLQGLVDKQQAHADSISVQIAHLTNAKELGDQRLAEAKERLAETKRWHDEMAELKKKAEEEKLDQPAHGSFYDVEKGTIRQITKREQQENLTRMAANQPPLYTDLTAQQVSLLERLGIAPKILDRMDTLVEKITAAAPGENITTGLLNRIATKAGISGDLQEFRSLSADQALELTAALSGGQPRMTILQIIRGEATPQVFMTTEAAQRAIDTARVTIRNRMAQVTHDPDTMDKMSRSLADYGPRKKKSEVLSRTDPLYQRARTRGLTDQQIQSQYGLTLTD